MNNALSELPEPPASLGPEGGVEGWRVFVRAAASARAASAAPVAAAALFVLNLSALGWLLPSVTELGLPMWVAALSGLVLLDLLAGAGIVQAFRRGAKHRVAIRAQHLVVEHLGRRHKVAWNQVFPAEKTETGGLRIRWTTDGTEAAFAHERTAVDSLRLETGVSPKGRHWLRKAVEHARTVDAERRRGQAFDELTQGRRFEKGLEALQQLRGEDGERSRDA